MKEREPNPRRKAGAKPRANPRTSPGAKPGAGIEFHQTRSQLRAWMVLALIFVIGCGSVPTRSRTSEEPRSTPSEEDRQRANEKLRIRFQQRLDELQKEGRKYVFPGQTIKAAAGEVLEFWYHPKNVTIIVYHELSGEFCISISEPGSSAPPIPASLAQLSHKRIIAMGPYPAVIARLKILGFMENTWFHQPPPGSNGEEQQTAVTTVFRFSDNPHKGEYYVVEHQKAVLPKPPSSFHSLDSSAE